MPHEWENPEFSRKKERKRRIVLNLIAGVAVLGLAAGLIWLRRIPEDKKIPQKPRSFGASVPEKSSSPASGEKKKEAEIDVAMEILSRSSSPALSPSSEAGSVDEKIATARAAFEQGDHEKALLLFQQILPGEKKVSAEIGAIYFRLGRIEESISYLEQAVALDEENPRLHKLLALAYYQADRLEPSLIHAQKAFQVSPDGELQQLIQKLSQETRVQKNYLESEAAHFRILWDGREHEEIRVQVFSVLKEAERKVNGEWGMITEQPISVILYSQQEFFDVTRSPSWAGGLFDGKIRLPVRNLSGQEELLKRVLTHEYIHALVHGYTNRCPRWINEGLAEYFSEPRIEPIGQLIPLKMLESGFPGSPIEAVQIAYLQSQSAVTDLIDRYGLFRFKDFLVYLSKGEPVDSAFGQALGISYDRFVSTWRVKADD